MSIFNEIFQRPFLNVLVFIYNFLPFKDFGVAIIVLTLLIKIIFFPLTLKTAKAQKALNNLAPEVSKIKEKFKNDQAKQSAAIMQLYKENKVNPLSGCLPLLIQLPILIGLYKAFLDGLNPESLSLLYGFVENPGLINKMFIGLIDITAKSPILAILAGGLQMIQAKLSGSMTSASKEMAAISKQMLYFFPIMIIIIGWNLPAGLLLYWVASTLFSIGEQWYIRSRT